MYFAFYAVPCALGWRISIFKGVLLLGNKHILQLLLLPVQRPMKHIDTDTGHDTDNNLRK